MSHEIKALGQHVVLKVVAKSAGTEETTSSGIVIGVRQQGELPTQAEIFKIGDRVPEGLFEIGDITPIPLGEKLNVPHPDVAFGLCEPKERDEKYMTTHFSNISCVYKAI